MICPVVVFFDNCKGFYHDLLIDGSIPLTIMVIDTTWKCYNT